MKKFFPQDYIDIENDRGQVRRGAISARGGSPPHSPFLQVLQEHGMV